MGAAEVAQLAARGAELLAQVEAVVTQARGSARQDHQIVPTTSSNCEATAALLLHDDDTQPLQQTHGVIVLFALSRFGLLQCTSDARVTNL